MHTHDGTTLHIGFMLDAAAAQAFAGWPERLSVETAASLGTPEPRVPRIPPLRPHDRLLHIIDSSN